eukprot:CAMPEP_0184730280 /NCGR_PEP_ID=MMETSP0314-20130426/47070_1 /TAXON_ID=38298 /ORGANISM="Rhodella maculata, Strain CCMP 736" /LENGTH=249 /DNA_ID=CAMNT_0027196447 /DNA_START=22 /DNA_END=768 /DNA_ORIENTATION=+
MSYPNPLRSKRQTLLLQLVILLVFLLLAHFLPSDFTIFSIPLSALHLSIQLALSSTVLLHLLVSALLSFLRHLATSTSSNLDDELLSYLAARLLATRPTDAAAVAALVAKSVALPPLRLDVLHPTLFARINAVLIILIGIYFLSLTWNLLLLLLHHQLGTPPAAPPPAPHQKPPATSTAAAASAENGPREKAAFRASTTTTPDSPPPLLSYKLPAYATTLLTLARPLYLAVGAILLADNLGLQLNALTA